MWLSYMVKMERKDKLKDRTERRTCFTTQNETSQAIPERKRKEKAKGDGISSPVTQLLKVPEQLNNLGDHIQNRNDLQDNFRLYSD